MDNILYIGPYREFSGMGNASRQYIKALIVAGHNVSVCPIYNIYRAYPEVDIDPDILHRESNLSTSYDKVIQHTYPHQYSYDYRFAKNIGILHLESHNYYQNLTQYINLMDEIIVGSQYVAHSVRTSGVCTAPIRVVPEPIDLEMVKTFRASNPPVKKTSQYKFYTIGNYISRKNLDMVVTAFLSLFTTHDQVELIIKTKEYGQPEESLQQALEYDLQRLYESVKNLGVNKPKVMIGETSYKNILHIHNNGDCFINASSGESFGYSTLEAMAFNNNIIATNNTGGSEIIDSTCGKYVHSEPVGCVDNHSHFLYNSIHQQWNKPTVNSLMKQMIGCMEESESEKEERIISQNNRIKKFSLETVSNLLATL